MDARHFEVAAEFCKLVGSPDLLEYLGLGQDADPEEARGALKKRRKRMQGMQGNPKYKQEALFLIKHFGALDSALTDTTAYVADALRRAESVHLPILEMTVKGVIGAGSLSADQEEYLRRNALELGVSEAAFDELVDRLTAEAGISRPGRTPGPPPQLEPEERVDFYKLFGVAPHATQSEIAEAYARKRSEATQLADRAASERVLSRVELAWTVLSDAEARRQYDLQSSRTGPPARTRELRPDQAATAPPVRQRSNRPKRSPGETSPGPSSSPGGTALPARLEIHGEPVRTVKSDSEPVRATIEVENGGELPMPGSVRSDQPWATVAPTRLDPDAKRQTLSVVFDPSAMATRHETAIITIETMKGDRARVVFELERALDRKVVAAGVVGAFVLVFVAAGVAVAITASM